MPELDERPSNEIRVEETRNVLPPINRVPAHSAIVWLARGTRDMRAAPLASLFYGFCFGAMGITVSMVFEHAYQYTSALTSGFLLLGPFLAMGLYELSRQHERGEPMSLGRSLVVWRRNAANIGIFALVLIVIFLVWARASLIMFALFYTNEMPNLSGFLSQVMSLENLDFLAVYSAVGAFFAVLVFALSAVSIPMMLDRGQDAITAMLTSFAAVTRNLLPLLIWGILIAALATLGFLTFHIGLVFFMPLIGHGTWHAYRAVVGPTTPAA
ncbi:DUF2189 domain-containing protein [Niveibacterium sp. SC-1]|uniref:DUF2189 domain-containing protein n=1 Tax=Niveibacterium sp. SC-1 TaxID=3135646 RepID=UPI00311EADCD